MTTHNHIIASCIIIAISVTGNTLLGMSMRHIPYVPLFMDTIFTVAATLSGGLIPGIVTGLLTNISLSVFNALLKADIGMRYVYALCNMTSAIVVFIGIKAKKKSFMPMNVIMLTIVLCITNSIEGGLLSALVYKSFEMVPSDFIVAGLIMMDTPLVMASIISRIPINLADKLIAVVMGGVIASGFGKIETHLCSCSIVRSLSTTRNVDKVE